MKARFLPCALALFVSTLPVFSQSKSIDAASEKLVKEIMENEMVTVIHAKGRMGMENFAGTEGIQIINAYQIAKHEVTQELYTAVMGENPSYFKNNPGSDQLNDVAWCDDNSYEKIDGRYKYKTHEVGKKQANALGLYDMSGNVWEWCDNYSDMTMSIRGAYRGGSYSSYDTFCEVSYHGDTYPANRNRATGFRFACSVF